MSQRVEPCGCVVTVKTGHTLTKFCDQHYIECFGHPKKERDNRDLVGADNSDLVG